MVFCGTILGGLYLEGLIHGRAYFRNFTVLFSREVLHLASFLKWEFLELGNGSNGLFSGAWIPPIMQFTLIEDVDREQGRRSGESTRLPPMLGSIPPSMLPLIPPLNPGSDATRGFILQCYCPCVDRFLSGCSGFLPSLKKNQNTKNLIRNVVDEHHFEEVFLLKR